MMVLKNLYPGRVFYYFEQLAAIPHGSGNTGAVSDWLAKFARGHRLIHSRDEAGNVIIFKDATAGYESAAPVILQGHMDMVCEREADCGIDFEREGLSLFVENGYVGANGTTLGADDGIAVAYMLALLEADDLPHPALEAVFTVDEEIGMLGARDIDLSPLKGRTMLNLDSEEEGEFLTSCAGGVSLVMTVPVRRISGSGRSLLLTVTGLLGGHSGGEIHRERGNADLLMGRVLFALRERMPLGIRSLRGGRKDNAIPRECTAGILVPEERADEAVKLIEDLGETLGRELAVSDPGIRVTAKDEGNRTEAVLDGDSAGRVLFYLKTVQNGVLHRSQAMPELVETSLNLGIVELEEESFRTVTSIRSSVGSRKEEVKGRVLALAREVGGEVEIQGDYPAWEYRQDSPLRERVSTVYGELYDEKPIFTSIHAGLECGIFSEKLPGVDCVSFGPNILDIHTPKERLDIASTGRVWDFLVAFLEQAR